MRIFSSVIRDLPTTFSLAWNFAQRDFRSRYLGSIGGYFWAFASPALYATIFLIIKSRLAASGLEVSTAGVSPVAFAFIGIVVFQAWIEGLTNQLNYLRRAAPFMKTLKINAEVFFFSGCILSLLDFIVKLILIALVMLVFEVFQVSGFLTATLYFFLAVISGNVIGYLLALPGAFYADINKFIQSISLGILLGTPLLYEATTTHGTFLYWIQALNPLAVLVDVARSNAFNTYSQFLYEANVWIIILLILMLILLPAHRIAAPFVMERI